MTSVAETTACAPQASSDGEQESAGGEYVLVHAPIGRDALLAAQALQTQGVSTRIGATIDALMAALGEDTTALLLTIDGMDNELLRRLGAHLQGQPPWSDLPILLLVSDEDPAAFDEILRIFGNVTLLQRPLRRSFLLSVVQTSLRARRRQYQVRDLLHNAESARQEAERQQRHIEMLNERLRRAMTETHHRVKNNLQVIAAMVDMQVMEDTNTLPVSEFRRLGSHISMLAAVHDLLTEQAKDDGQARFVSSGAVIEKLLPLLQQISGHRMTQPTIMDVPLSAKQGTSMALALNELVSNAYKHGKGHVEVSFTVTGAEAILEVCDDGPGFPPDFDPVRAANTGLELVESLSRWDLGGNVRYTTRPQGGGRVRVTIPLIAPDKTP